MPAYLLPVTLKMKTKTNIKLPLSERERAALRKNKIRMAELLNYAADELEVLLNISAKRAKELRALAEFQTVPSVGIRFAEDLVFLGYHALHELKHKDGARLTDAYELKKGYWVDPCVEDQFRLVVHVANTGETAKNWWDFTDTRKKYRAEKGYPSTRPGKAWHETLK